MNKTFEFCIIAFLLTIYLYIAKIDSIPNEVVIYNGEKLNINNFFGLTVDIDNKDVYASSNISNSENKNDIARVKLFDIFTLKEINVNFIEESTVVPIGQISGLKLYTGSSFVVGMSEILGEDNQKYKPYENSGIREGDRIIKIDETEIIDTNTLIEVVNKSNGKTLNIKYVRENEVYSSKITPIKQSNGNYKLGLWVRDSAAGIGTMTYYEPATRKFCSIRTWNYRYRYRRLNSNFKW